MTQRGFMSRIIRARKELDGAVQELATAERANDPGTISNDLLEIRARVASLEARVEVIEERGDD